MNVTTAWIMSSSFWLVSTVRLLNRSEFRLPYCSRLFTLIFNESSSEHRSWFSASNSVIMSWFTQSCLSWSSSIVCWCWIVISCLLTLSCSFLLVSKIGSNIDDFKLSIAEATQDLMVSWINGAIISHNTGVMLWLNVLSFSVSFRLSEKVLGGIFFFSFGVNLLISGIEFCFFKGLSVSGEPLRFFSGMYWPKLSGMSSDSPSLKWNICHFQCRVKPKLISNKWKYVTLLLYYYGMFLCNSSFIYKVIHRYCSHHRKFTWSHIPMFLNFSLTAMKS